MSKPITQLQPEDLAAHPIWEFALDEEKVPGQDETWVRPLASQTIPRNTYSLSVAARFTTHSGKELSGLVEVNTVGEVVFGHGALFAEGQYVFLPAPQTPHAPAARQRLAASLDLSLTEVFPLRFTLKALVAGEIAYRRGTYIGL